MSVANMTQQTEWGRAREAINIHNLQLLMVKVRPLYGLIIIYYHQLALPYLRAQARQLPRAESYK